MNIFCPKCETACPEESRFCLGCGYALQRVAVARPVTAERVYGVCVHPPGSALRNPWKLFGAVVVFLFGLGMLGASIYMAREEMLKLAEEFRRMRQINSRGW